MASKWSKSTVKTIKHQAALSLSRIQFLESRRHFIGRTLPQRATGAPEPGKFAMRHRLRPGTDFSHSLAVLGTRF